jgi:hypothetical protein
MSNQPHELFGFNLGGTKVLFEDGAPLISMDDHVLSDIWKGGFVGASR